MRYVLPAILTVFAAVMISMPTTAQIQPGSTGGTIGKQGKSVSGGEEAVEPQQSSPKRRRRIPSADAASSEGRRQATSLAGQWRGPFGATQISQQQGGNLTFRNEVGSVSHGRWLDPSTVTAYEWGVEGKVSSDGKSIAWTNSTQWSR
jgi:hypothetical protein